MKKTKKTKIRIVTDFVIYDRNWAAQSFTTNVTAHSIIAVKNPDDPREKWVDGVVSYSSAHIDDVTSELVVHSGHSTQSDPETIEEVRRILLEHLGLADP